MKPYIPDELPPRDLDYRALFALVGAANRELARYDGLLQGIPNPEVMLSPLTTREAVLSSKIEGTQATVDEVLEHEAGLLRTGEKEKDIQEIFNYRRALMMSHDVLKERPITLGFIRQLHEILLDSVRGHNKNPGVFREDQNWIGPDGCAMEEASFVPPEPLIMEDHLRKWEHYLRIDDSDFLLQTAVAHAQFELLHPFKDGNGRIGRLLIPLFLFQKKVLSQPMFYLSEYLESHRDAYYQRLGNISRHGDWNGWISFFLEAVEHQARQNSLRVRSMMALYEETKVKIQETTRSQYAVYLLDGIFSKPIFISSDMVKVLNQKCDVHEKTGATMLKKLKEIGILRELRPSSGRRSAILVFSRLINLAEGKEVV